MTLYGENREDHRQILFDVWKKYQTNQPLEPLEKKILTIMLNHPEYAHVFSNEDKFIATDYFSELSETNPFLHLSLHLVILEQVEIDKPNGIRALYKQAIAFFQDVHEADHCIMNSLAIAMHEMLNQNKPFDEKAYLKRIKIALKKGYW